MTPNKPFEMRRASFGITLPEELRSDKMQRFDPATGNIKGKDLSGFCRFYTDGVPAGFFGDWATGVKEKWTAHKLNGTLTEQERLAHNERVNTLQSERELEERRQLEGGREGGRRDSRRAPSPRRTIILTFEEAGSRLWRARAQGSPRQAVPVPSGCARHRLVLSDHRRKRR